MQFTDAQLGVIIGGVVGAFFILAIVVAIGTYCKRRLLRRGEVADKHLHKPEVIAGDLDSVKADTETDADTMFAFGPNASTGMSTLGLQHPRPSSQFCYPTYLVSPAAASAVDHYAPRSSLVFPSAATTKLGPGVVRPVSWAASFPEPSTLGLSRADNGSATGWLSTVGALQRSPAEHLSYSENVVQMPSSEIGPLTTAAGIQSDDVFGGMVSSRDSGNWSWTAPGQSSSVRSWITVDSKYISQQRQQPVSNDLMTTSAFDSVDVDFTVPTAGELSRRPVVADDVSTGASDPYVARASVIGDGGRLQSTATAAASDLTRDRGAVKTNRKEDGAATVFVEGFHEETCGDDGSQATFEISSAKPISRGSVTSSTPSRDREASPYMVTARTDGPLTEQSFTHSDLGHRSADTVAIAKISGQTQTGNNSTADNDVINDATMRSALAEWERIRTAAQLSTSVVPTAATESSSYIAGYQPNVDSWRQQLERPDHLEYSTGRQANGPVLTNVHWPANPPGDGGIGGRWSRATRNDVDADEEQFETRLPTRNVDASSGFRQPTQYADRKQIAIGGAYASPSQSTSALSPFANLDRQLQQLHFERQHQGGENAPAGRQMPGGSRSPKSFIRSDSKPKTDAGDKELIGDAFKFLDDFEE